MFASETDPQPTTNAIQARVAQALRDSGWIALTDFVPHGLLVTLRRDCDEAEHAGRLRAAATGRGPVAQTDPALRGDRILWLDRSASPVQAELLEHLDGWRQALNRQLWLGLEEVESHYALYAPGAGYARHRDRFRDDDARVLSLVIYLNADWADADGGALRLQLPEGACDIAPRMGTAVLFLSSEIEHEVLPARRTRRSIAGWFRRRALS